MNLASIGVGVLIGAVLFAVAWFIQWRLGRGRLGSAQNIATRIIDEAKKEAETRKKEAILEAKEEWYRAKEKFEQETASRRKEMEKLDKRFAEKEASLNRRVELLEKKETESKRREVVIAKREEELGRAEEEVKALVEKENRQLERIAGLSTAEAKHLLMQNLEEEARHEASGTLRQIREEAKRTAEKEAKKIITQAIQRCAADHAVENTVSVVTLPNDEMKGRIIGREGRNIRSFETATGVDVIIDDTPGAVVLSGFDPIRREVARLSLERLISDGRIHPGRIEELVVKVQKELDERIVEIGEQTVLEIGIVGLHEDLVKLLGRLHFRTSYGQNVLQHAKEVAWLCGLMASELRLDPQIAKRAGILHDIGKALTHETEGIHSLIGGDVAERCGEPPQVVNAIRAHHDDVEAISLYAPLVQAADAISGARPGARGETLETYVRRLEKLETLATSFKGVDKCFAIQAGREIRIMVESEKVSDEEAASLSSSIARKVEKELEYPGQIKVVVIRETRAVEFAR
ncbi:MAG: ribonuclease Y [Candidatus Latescibacterota bacterium]|nr:MAG: ribonuclease Y [Candidatus Latescibacterota bacterium]